MDSKDFKNQILPIAERIYPMVARMLGGHENAEDAVQDIMIKLWKDRKKIKDHPNYSALVFTTARNYCIDLLRKKKVQYLTFENVAHLHFKGNHHDETEWKELNTLVNDILKELPEKQAEILIMRDLDGMEYSEIAELTKLKIDNVRMTLSRARKKLGEKLLTIYNYEYRERETPAS